jgi:D-alanyl-D-alanine endopeptidase (penicillin-binding protein 7)
LTDGRRSCDNAAGVLENFAHETAAFCCFPVGFAAPDGRRWIARPARLKVSSANVLVLDAAADRQVYAKAADEVTPIASVTKLMTAMVVLDARLSLDEILDIDTGDFDYLKGSHSRLAMGSSLTRREMLRLALMSSENRAASSLARHYPAASTRSWRR